MSKIQLRKMDLIHRKCKTHTTTTEQRQTQMATETNQAYWKESTRLKEKNSRRAARRKANPGFHNPKAQSKKKEK